MTAIKITEANFTKEIIESEKPVLVDFFATWCGPCKMVSPIIEKIAAENPDLKVCKIDIDEQMKLATAYNVMSVPTLIAIKNGQEVKRIVGAVPQTEILKMFGK